MNKSAVGKTMTLLDLLLEQGALALEELHILSELPKATVKRLMDELVALGWVYRRLGDRRYCLLKAGREQNHATTLAPRFEALLRELHDRTGFCSDIALDLGDGLEVVESNYGLSGYRLATRYLIGLRPDARVSAIGRAFRARRALGPDAGSEDWRELERERQRGFHRRVPGIWEHAFAPPFEVRGVAVPILHADSAVGALNLYWDGKRYGDFILSDRHLALLDDAAGQVAALLAYS